ncbi:MAG: cardiolipin synthase [Clostridia bacterium]|nr:cardiolipin synthase [Clostridia bacterium]MBQ8720104.1 cardiolipin synthase [Clostridia bacterium]
MRKLYKIIFSRYAICALMLAAEVVLSVLFCMYAMQYYAVLVAVYIAVMLISIVGVMNADANPDHKLPWLVIIACFPLVGLIAYSIFRYRRMTRGEERRMRESFRSINEANGVEDKLALLGIRDSAAAGKAHAVLQDDELAKVYTGTASRYFSEGRELYDSLLSDVLSAEKFIFLEYFIIEEGVMWDGLLSVLKEKVAAGVEVRVMYDDFGCMSTLPSRYDRRLERCGIRCCRFSKVSPHFRTVYNNRDHRKIAVIDGRVGYTGGVNLADEYINEKLRFGHWKDGGVRISGDATVGLVALFLSLWELASGERDDAKEYMASASQTSSDGGFYIPYGSGPFPAYPRPVGKNVLLNIINQAHRYLYLTTPYLIIDYDLTEALRGAAARGVDVRIITPGVADKRIVKVMTKSSYPYLIEGGVRIFEYTRGFIHEKTVVSDDLYATVGTINLDYRSLVHHYEDGVWMYGTPTVLNIRDSYMKTLADSREIGEREARLGILERLVRNAVRLVAPLL